MVINMLLAMERCHLVVFWLTRFVVIKKKSTKVIDPAKRFQNSINFDVVS